MLIYQVQSLSDISDFHFQRNIRVCHRACADHAFLTLMSKRMLQQVDGVFFDFNVFKGMFHVIAFASGVTVNAPVLSFLRNALYVLLTSGNHHYVSFVNIYYKFLGGRGWLESV